MGPNPAKLMRSGKPSHDYPVADVHVTGQCCVIRHDRMATDSAIVRDVHISHDPVVIAHDGLAGILHRTAADSAVFTNRVSISDREPRWFARILFVLRIITD